MLLIGIMNIGALMYSMGLELVIDQVMFRLAAFAANVALGPCVGRWPIRMDIFHVLSQVAG